MSFLEAIPMVFKYLFKYIPILPFSRFHTSIIISQYIIYNPLYTMGSSKSPQTRILKMKIPIR